MRLRGGFAFLALGLFVAVSAFGADSWRHGEREPLWPEGRIPNLGHNQRAGMTDEPINDPAWRKAHQMPYLEWFEPPKNPNGACLILVSGGSYLGLVDVGLIKQWKETFTELGYRTVNLVYRTPTVLKGSGWQDGQRAVRLIRASAAKRGIDPEKIGAIGMSAGGHLVTMLATCALTPSYEKVDALDDLPCHLNWCIAHAPAYNSAAGRNGKATPADGTTAPASAVGDCFAFDAKTCPVSFQHGAIDPYTPNGSVRCYEELRRRGILAELHLFANRSHGAFGLERAIEFMNGLQLVAKLAPAVDLTARFADDSARASVERESVWPEGRGEAVLDWHFPRDRKTTAVLLVCEGAGDAFDAASLRRYLNERGMTVVTLSRSCALQDLQRAVRVVRSRAPEKGLNPDFVGALGAFDAARTVLLNATGSRTPAYSPVDGLDRLPCKMKWAVAVNPPRLLKAGVDELALPAGDEGLAALDPAFAFDADTCSACFICGDAEGLSAMGCVKVWEKMRRMNIQSELHSLAFGGRGFLKAASPGTGAFTWMDRVWDYFVVKNVLVR